MQDTNKHLRQSIELNLSLCENGGDGIPQEGVEARLCPSVREGWLIKELTEDEYGEVEKGWESFEKKHDTGGELSVIRLRYFARLAYFFGYHCAKHGKDPTDI